MLPLSGSAFPGSASDLQRALEDGLRHAGLPPREVQVSGTAYPQLSQVAVDLSGVKLDRTVPRLTPGAWLEGQVETAEFSVQANPILLEGVPAHFHLAAHGVTLREQAAHPSGRVLGLAKGEGTLKLEIKAADLEKLAHTAAREAAKQKGADVPELKLTLAGSGGRSVELHCEVVGKFGFLKATLHVTGRAELEQGLRLRLSGLDVKGSGMAAGLATTFIRPQLAKLEGKTFALDALPLGDLKIRDVRLTPGETLRLQAEFGS